MLLQELGKYGKLRTVIRNCKKIPNINSLNASKKGKGVIILNRSRMACEEKREKKKGVIGNDR